MKNLATIAGKIFLASQVILLLLLSTTAHSQTKKIPRSCSSAFTIHKNGGTQSIRFASNFSIDKTDTAITTLLVYVHGIDRNGFDYFEYAEGMVSSAKKKNETLVIAPQYANEDDLDYYKLSGDFLYWKNAEWKDGHTSASEGDRQTKIKVSSYEILDSIVVFVLASNYFPNIKRVVIAGHSAGGQFVDRYSTMTPLPDLFPRVPFRFIVMDPSSYLYPDGRRPLSNKAIALPDSTACPEYNHYPKGLVDLNSYAKAVGAEKIIDNMMHRDIVILLGEKDVSIDDPNLDITCAANLQGGFRLERGMNFIEYIRTFPAYGDKKNYGIVPNTGHSGDNMINSDIAKKWVFGE